MHVMKERWTDDRMDGFEAAVDVRFDAIDKRFDSVEGRLTALEGEMKSLHRTLLHVGGGIIVALVGVIATQI
jgi:hypothetical protein